MSTTTRHRQPRRPADGARRASPARDRLHRGGDAPLLRGGHPRRRRRPRDRGGRRHPRDAVQVVRGQGRPRAGVPARRGCRHPGSLRGRRGLDIRPRRAARADDARHRRRRARAPHARMPLHQRRGGIPGRERTRAAADRGAPRVVPLHARASSRRRPGSRIPARSRRRWCCCGTPPWSAATSTATSASPRRSSAPPARSSRRTAPSAHGSAPSAPSPGTRTLAGGALPAVATARPAGVRGIRHRHISPMATSHRRHADGIGHNPGNPRNYAER